MLYEWVTLIDAMASSYTVAQNTSFLTAASVLQKIISAGYFVILARFIGAHATGDYFTILTAIALFTVVADFGFGAVLTREAARTPEKIDAYLSTVLGAKFVMGVLAVLLLYGARFFFHYPPQPWSLIILAGITLFFDGMQNAAYAVCRAQKNLLYEAFGIICAQFLTLLIGLVALTMHWPFYWLIIAYAIPSLLSNIYGFSILRVRLGVRFNLNFDKELFRHFFLLAWPFALAGFISRLYSYNDSLIMIRILSRQEIGWWSAAYKMAFAFQFIPVALGASLFPAMSSLYVKGREHVIPLFFKSYRYVLLVAGAVAGGLCALAQPVVHNFYGQSFLPSVPVLQLLIVSLVFNFVQFIHSAALNASGHQRSQTLLMGATLVLSTGLNLVLIPRYGILGAAVTALVGNAFLAISGTLVVHHFLSVPLGALFRLVSSIIFPAIIMAGVVYWLSHRIFFVTAIPFGAIVYLSLLLLTGGLEYKMIQQVFARIFARQV